MFDENFHIHYIGARDSKKEKLKKKAKINLSTLVSFTVIHSVVLIVHTKFEDSSTHRCSELIRWKNCWKERKNDK